MKLDQTGIVLHKETVKKMMKPWYLLRQHQKPEMGWIKSIRIALGITTKQLAEKMGIAQPNIIAIEERELLRTISLETLDKAARAMNCKLIYAIVPNEDFTTAEAIQPMERPAPIERPVMVERAAVEDELSLLQKSLRNNHY